jgi:hypothetical protein
VDPKRKDPLVSFAELASPRKDSAAIDENGQTESGSVFEDQQL